MSNESPTPPPVDPRAAAPATPSTLALPSPAAVLRALRGPLIGYAITFGVAIVMVALLVLAAGIDSSGSDLDADTFHQAGVYLLTPFQLVAMALLGKLRLAEDGGSVTYLAPPLALTLTYLYVVARVSRTWASAADNAARAVLAGAAGLVTAVVVTLGSWALAVRDDGATVHAAGVSLFFGSWILTGLAVFAGSRHGAGLRWPAFVPVEYAEAIRLWFQSIALWVAVAVPLIMIAAGFQEGPWFALLFPLWAVTGGLYTYSIAHFAGVTAFTETVGVFDFTAVWTIVALIGTVVITVLTAVVWSLRRNKNPDWLSNPTSWTVLPAIYVGAAILVWLVPSTSVGGAFGGLGGSITVRPSPLLFATLPIAGLVTEFLSRTVGVTLAAGLSPAMATRLRGKPIAAPATADDSATTTAPGAEPGTAPVTPAPRAPLTAEEKKRWLRVGIIAGVVVLVLGGGAVTVSVINSSSYSAKATAQKYLDAVVDGDLNKALQLAPVDRGAKKDLLTAEVYKSARGKITGYSLGKTESFGDMTLLTVHLKGDFGGDDEVQLRLTKKGKKDVFFDNWKIEDGGLASQTTFELPDGSDSISVGETGVSISEDGDYWLYPGGYAFNPYGDSKWLTGGSETLVEPSSSGFADFSDPQPTQAFEDEANSQLTAYLDACMAATTLEPAGCPNASYASDVRKVKWTMTKAPTIDFDSFQGGFPADLSTEPGTASVTYEYDQNYGFGPKDYVTDSDDDVSLYVSIKVEEDGDGLKFTFDG